MRDVLNNNIPIKHEFSLLRILQGLFNKPKCQICYWFQSVLIDLILFICMFKGFFPSHVKSKTPWSQYMCGGHVSEVCCCFARKTLIHLPQFFLVARALIISGRCEFLHLEEAGPIKCFYSSCPQSLWDRTYIPIYMTLVESLYVMFVWVTGNSHFTQYPAS